MMVFLYPMDPMMVFLYLYDGLPLSYDGLPLSYDGLPLSI